MNKPLCIIVDDEAPSLSALQNHIEELGLLEIEKSFLDPDKFLVKIDSLKSNIIFLDLEMPITGDKIAEKLKNKHIIFVSGHKELGYLGFEVGVIDFVPKPIRQSRLKEAIEKVLKFYKTNNLIVLKTQNSKKQEINTESIFLISSCKNEPRDKRIILSNKKEIIAKNINFDSLLKLLPNNFTKVNPSQIANLKYVTHLIDSDTIGINIMGEIKEINLGDSYKNNFFAAKPNFK